MIAPLAIAASLLAILDDDNEVDFEDLFQRAVAFENPQILMEKLGKLQRKELSANMDLWISSSSNLDELKERIDTASWFFSKKFEPSKIPTFGGRPIIGVMDPIMMYNLETEQLNELLSQVKNEKNDVAILNWIEERCGIHIDTILSWDEERILIHLDIEETYPEDQDEYEEISFRDLTVIISRGIPEKYTHAVDSKFYAYSRKDAILRVKERIEETGRGE